MAATRFSLDLDGFIARLTLSSDDGENRIGAVAIDDLHSACAALGELADVRALIVSGGTDTCFSLGWDAALLSATGEADAVPLPGDPFGCLEVLPLPVIAEIGGDCFSAGLELALACDVRVAASDARFAFPETAFGLIPLAGGSQRLPRAVGRGRALGLILLGDIVGATTALDWGLLQAMTEPGGSREATQRLAETIAARGPIAERFAKEAVQQGVELPLARALRYELDLTVLLQTTEDRAEGVRAFAEKRSPRFVNR